MKVILTLAALASVLSSPLAVICALAQSAPSVSTKESPGVEANKPSAGTLTPGANSFSEEQARSHIKAQGYTDVSALINDKQGIWRGSAMKDNAKMNVSVDYLGKVDAEPSGSSTESKAATGKAGDKP